MWRAHWIGFLNALKQQKHKEKATGESLRYVYFDIYRERERERERKRERDV